MEELIQKLREASTKTTDGSVFAVFDVSCRFAATVALSKEEIVNLSEDGLRSMLAERVDEMIGMTETSEEIDVAGITEVRDGETDEVLEQESPATFCKKCGSPIHGDYCSDDTCAYSEWPQRVPYDKLARDSAPELRERYGVQLRLRVHAEAHSDDYRVEVAFDAAPWFAQASDEAIVRLADAEWGTGEAADVVAEHFTRTHERIAFMFDYLDTFPEGAAIGFECSVDPDSAKDWLKQNRPGLWARLRCAENDVNLVEAQEEEIRGRWDWIGQSGDASESSFETVDEAALNAVEVLGLDDNRELAHV